MAIKFNKNANIFIRHDGLLMAVITNTRNMIVIAINESQHILYSMNCMYYHITTVQWFGEHCKINDMAYTWLAIRLYINSFTHNCAQGKSALKSTTYTLALEKISIMLKCKQINSIYHMLMYLYIIISISRSTDCNPVNSHDSRSQNWLNWEKGKCSLYCKLSFHR